MKMKTSISANFCDHMRGGRERVRQSNHPITKRLWIETFSGLNSWSRAEKSPELSTTGEFLTPRSTGCSHFHFHFHFHSGFRLWASLGLSVPRLRVLLLPLLVANALPTVRRRRDAAIGWRPRNPETSNASEPFFETPSNFKFEQREGVGGRGIATRNVKTVRLGLVRREIRCH